MNDSNDDDPAAPETADWQKTAESWSARAQDYFRDEPNKAVGFAVLAGVLLTVLPVGRLFGLIIRIALGLVRPALLILGGVKLYEEVEKRCRH